ncbi:MAG TPA: NmrA family NAD(P)-binding protein [Puia sp.]|nr:NmrA family NAD(P)-binding protein [Puia sp.]
MKYVVTGGAGHISKPLVLALLKAGKQVTVIGRNPEHLKELTAQGATAAVGSVEDGSFLAKTFNDADAVYTMVPPKWDVSDWKGYIGSIGQLYADALKKSRVKYVVNLSSVGAHMPTECGPVSGLYRVEQALNGLSGVAVRHLRPGFFYENLLANIGMVKNMNIMGGNYGDRNVKMVLVEPADIASVAAKELLTLNFTGHSVLYIASDERKTGDIAAVLGKAVGKPDLPWVEFSDEQAIQGMKQAGLSEEVSRNYAEMGRAIRTGEMTADYWKNHPDTLQATKLEDFARIFAAVYNNGH